MERRIVLHFRDGNGKDISQDFPVDGLAGIRLGRETVCEIAFDIERDEGVSRVHCRIDVESADPPLCKLTDLKSRNGTFVNRQRITGSVALRPGDILQLGPDGPEVEFTITGAPATQWYPPPVAQAAAPPPPAPKK